MILRRTLLALLLLWIGSSTTEAATGVEFAALCTVKVDGKTYLRSRKCRVDFWANLTGPIPAAKPMGLPFV